MGGLLSSSSYRFRSSIDDLAALRLFCTGLREVEHDPGRESWDFK